MARVAILLDPAGGVSEVRLLAEGDSRFDGETLLRFLRRLGPVLCALDDGLRVTQGEKCGPTRMASAAP